VGDIVLRFAIRFAIALPLFAVVLGFGVVILAASLLQPAGSRHASFRGES
jgi:hypothetical protein